MHLSYKFLRFIIVGVGTYLFALCQMFIYTQLIFLDYGVAYAITQFIIYIVSFMLARHWIYQSRVGAINKQAIKFLSLGLIFRFTDWCLFMLFHSIFGIVYYVSILLSVSIIIPMKYRFYGKLVFYD